MDIVMAGVSHHETPLALRERLFFPEDEVGESLDRLARYNGLRERVILSTCNRVEVYSVAENFEEGADAIGRFLCESGGVDPEELRGHLYVRRGEEAIRHLFQVAASLKSMVLGEPQILGQVKVAFRVAQERGHAGKSLNEIFSRAFHAAKKVREETDLGKSPVSVSSVAADLAKKIFRTLEGRSVLLLGAGEMGELAARHLIGNGADRVLVANRTYSRAEALAAELSGRAVPYDTVASEMAGADIVIAATGAPHFVLTREMVAAALEARRDAPIFLVDIAVPRNVDSSVNELENVYLYDIDDLQSVVADNKKGREEEEREAHRIVERELETLLRRLQMEELSRTFAAIRLDAEGHRQKEIERTLSRFAGMGEKEREAVDAMTRALVNKLLHRPFAALREMAAEEGGEDPLPLVQRLFGVKPPPEEKKAPGADE